MRPTGVRGLFLRDGINCCFPDKCIFSLADEPYGKRCKLDEQQRFGFTCTRVFMYRKEVVSELLFVIV